MPCSVFDHSCAISPSVITAVGEVGTLTTVLETRKLRFAEVKQFAVREELVETLEGE